MSDAGITQRQGEQMISLLEKIEGHLDSIRTQTLGTGENTSFALDALRDIRSSASDIERNQGPL